MPDLPTSADHRHGGVDALRGVAMLWMAAYHFSFDLNQYGYIHQDLHRDPVWTWQRTCILSLFLLCAGAGQALALHRGQTWSAFGRRCLQIAGCAALVSLGSWWMFPASFIYFGVLHGMLVMLLLVRLSAGWGRWLWPLGVLAVALKFLAASVLVQGSLGALGPLLDSPPLNWLGLVGHLPITEDYVPVLPWLGVMWWGMAATQWWLGRPPVAPRRASASAPAHHAVSALAALGRWSLSFYMLHQPVLLAGLWLWARLAH